MHFLYVFTFTGLFLNAFLPTISGYGIRVEREANPKCSNYSAMVSVRDSDGILLDPKTIKDDYHKVNFALRGPIYLRTTQILEELKQGTKKPFTELIKSGIVDAQSIGLKPLTFLRQMVSLVSLPDLMSSPMFPSDVIQRAKEVLSDMDGHTPGSCAGLKGLQVVRGKVTEFISKRDGFSVNINDIYLTEGVTGGVDMAFKLIQQECRDAAVGVMTPNPLYPLYSAMMSKQGLVKIGYNLNPEKNWALDVVELERAYNEAICSCNCKPRALLIINPGNPSGQILRRNNMEDIVKFAYSHNLILLIDEIYQRNLFTDVPFISMNKVVHEMGDPYNKMELISFYSISKGYASEVGLRGGYMHTVNLAKGVHEVMFKLASLKQCPNTIGQVALSSYVSPPQPGEPSYELYNKQVSDYYRDQKAVAKTLVAELNKLEGFNCSQIEGGPVAFPKFKIPEKAVKEAETRGMFPDIFYGLELLEKFGLNIAVGSAFGFLPTQHYMRISMPVNVSGVEKVIARLKPFHEEFLKKYA